MLFPQAKNALSKADVPDVEERYGRAKDAELNKVR